MGLEKLHSKELSNHKDLALNLRTQVKSHIWWHALVILELRKRRQGHPWDLQVRAGQPNDKREPQKQTHKPKVYGT